MDEATTLFTQWSHYVLIWVGFGTLVGLLAKMILPGKDPGGALATVVIGIFGSLIGASILFFVSGVRVSPISMAGFAIALIGTTILLVIYRVLYGQRWTTGMPVWKWKRAAPRRRATILDE